MRIALTGATGFLGRHVMLAAAAAGHEVVAFSRRPAASIAGACEVRGWTVNAPPDLHGCGAVIHLAGEPVLGLWTRSKRAAILESRVQGTRTVVVALRGSDAPRVLVCASAIGYYGDRGAEVVDEKSAAGVGFLADVTRAWEAEAMAAQTDRVRVVCGRIGLVLGADGGAWPVVRRVFSTGLGGRLGSGRQWMSWVHVRDVAQLLMAAATDDRYHGPINVVAPGPVTNADFTRAVAQAISRPAIIPVPEFLLRAALRDQAGLFLDSQRVRPQVARDLGYPFAFESLSAALADLTAARTSTHRR